MNSYQVNLCPIMVLVEAENEQEAEEEAMKMAYQGELNFEVEKIITVEKDISQ